MTDHGHKMANYWTTCVDTDQSCFECMELLKYLDSDEGYPTEICGDCFNHCGDTYRP